jgi:hypothetical protein
MKRFNESVLCALLALCACGCASRSFDGMYKADMLHMLQRSGIHQSMGSETRLTDAQMRAQAEAGQEDVVIHRGMVFKRVYTDGVPSVYSLGRLTETERHFALWENALNGVEHKTPVYMDNDGVLWTGGIMRYIKVSPSSEDLSEYVEEDPPVELIMKPLKSGRIVPNKPE